MMLMISKWALVQNCPGMVVKSSVLAHWVCDRGLWMRLVIAMTSVKGTCFVVRSRSKSVAADTAFEGALGMVLGGVVYLRRSAADWVAWVVGQELLVLKRCVRHGFAELSMWVELLVLKLVMHLRLMEVRRWASALWLELADSRRTSRLRMSLSTHNDGFFRSQAHWLLEVA